MVQACFKNEQRQNPKECFQHANKRKIHKRKTDQEANRRLGKMSFRKKEGRIWGEIEEEL